MALGKPDASASPAVEDKSGDGSIVPIDQAYVCLNPKSRRRQALTATSMFTVSGTPSRMRSAMPSASTILTAPAL